MQKKEGHSFVLAQSCCLVENVFIVDDAVFLSVRILSIWCRFQGLWKIQQELCTDTSIASEVWWIYWSLFAGGRRTGCPVCCYLGTGFSFPSSAQEEFSYFSSSSCLQYNHLLQSGTIFFFFFWFGSVTSTAVSQSRWWHKDFRLLSQTKSKLCVFMCEAHTHEGTWLHDWFMRWLEHSLLNKCVWVCHQRCSVNEHKSMFVSVISVSG